MQQTKQQIADKTISVLLTLAFLYIPMWLIFLVNRVIPDQVIYPFFGIHPRSFDFFAPLSFMTSWLVHINYDHIANNSLSLFWLAFFIALFEKRSLKLLIILIAASGLSTWLIGSSNTVHVGASGLIFAMFGYILSSVIFGKKWLYLIPVFISLLYYGFVYYTSFLKGMIPQDGISFAGHFGGCISGIIIGAFYEIKRKKKVDKKTHQI